MNVLDKDAVERRAINEIRTLLIRYRDTYAEKHSDTFIEHQGAIENVCNSVINTLDLKLTKLLPKKYEG